MLKRGFMAIVIAGMTLAGAGMAHSAGAVGHGDLPPAVAKKLDMNGVEFVRHTREHRLMEVQRNLGRQQRRERRFDRGGYRRGGPDYGYRRGYGAPRGYGRGGGRMYNGQPVLRAN